MTTAASTQTSATHRPSPRVFRRQGDPAFVARVLELHRDGRTNRAICNLLSCKRVTVKAVLDSHGLARRTMDETERLAVLRKALEAKIRNDAERARELVGRFGLPAAVRVRDMPVVLALLDGPQKQQQIADRLGRSGRVQGSLQSLRNLGLVSVLPGNIYALTAQALELLATAPNGVTP